MSSSLLLQQYPACLVRPALIVFVMGGTWPYSCCFIGCCLQDLFNIACCILVKLPSSFFSIRLVSVHVVHPYSSIDMTAAWKKLRFILSVRSDFHITDSLSIAVDKQTEHKFYTIFLISQMTEFKTTNADSLIKRPTFSCSTKFPKVFVFCIFKHPSLI